MGNKSLMPMDSYGSLTHALNIGSPGIEMDVQLTADSTLVLYHSVDLSDLTSGSGPISGKNFSEISGLSYKGFYPEKLCTPQHLFSNISKEGRHFVFDCKTTSEDNGYIEIYTRTLVDFIHDQGLTDQCFIESPTPAVLRSFNRRDQDLKLFLYTDTCRLGLVTAGNLPLYGLVMDWKKVTAAEIEQAHRMNLHFTLFNTTTEGENLEAIGMNPDFIQTDKLEHLLKIFEK